MIVVFDSVFTFGDDGNALTASVHIHTRRMAIAILRRRRSQIKESYGFSLFMLNLRFIWVFSFGLMQSSAAAANIS